MIYEILNDEGVVENRIMADEEFVSVTYPGRYRLATDTLNDQMPSEADYIDAMAELFDATALQRGYDNRVTCALRAGYPGPFQAEGMAFAQWMDGCNAKGYSLLAQVLGGTMPQPTVAGFIAMLPTLEWPPAVA